MQRVVTPICRVLECMHWKNLYSNLQQIDRVTTVAIALPIKFRLRGNYLADLKVLWVDIYGILFFENV